MGFIKANLQKLAKTVTVILVAVVLPLTSNNPTAQAVSSDPVVTAPDYVDFSSQNWAAGSFGISGYSVDAPASMSLLVSIYLSDAPTNDSITVVSHSNLTLSYGFSSGDWTGFTEISFTGLKADVNTALASTNFKYLSASGAKNSTARIKVLATENVPGVAYFAKDDHFYKVGHFMETATASLISNQDSGYFCGTGANAAYGSSADRATYISNYASIQTLTVVNVGDSRCTWSEANRLARTSTLKGRPGYLANITSQTENDFLKAKVQGALNSWIGGTDGANDGTHSNSEGTGFSYISNSNLPDTYTGGTEGLWHFYDGPEKGKIFWRYLGGYTGMSAPTYPITTHANWQTYRAAWETTGHNVGGGNTNISQANKNDVIGYSNWSSPNEPNNSSSAFTFTDAAGVTRTNVQQGEDNIVFNWVSANGYWNDLHGSEPTVPYYGYIIEYGDSTSFTGVSTTQVSIGYPLSVTLNPQNGSNTSTVSTAIAGQLSSPTTPTRSGYSFKGWFTSSSGGSAISFPYSHGQSSTFTLYAQWLADLNVTYNSQGGSAISSGTTASSGSISASPGSPTRSGYTFAGWFTSSSGGSAISFPYSHGQTSDFTLYAQWNAIPAPAPAPVPVGPPPPSKVQPPVTISVSKTEIEFGQTLQIDLSGGISGSGTTYSVSGTGLCSINSSGVITALKEGSCTITATKSSNADYKAADSNSITITVKPLQAIQNFGVSQPVPAGSTVIVIPKDNNTPVAVSTPKSSTSSATSPNTTSKSSTTTADRKVEVSQTPEKTVIQISPNQIQLSAKSGTNNSDILLSGLVKGLKIKATVVMLNGLTKTSTPATPAELNKIINSNPNSKVNIEITPTINQDLKKSAQIAVDGAKKNQRVKVTVK